MPEIPSNEEIVELLEQLEEKTADDLESEALEFVSWDKDMKKNLEQAVEGVVSFANVQGGVIVFGVEDKVVGRRQAITGCCGYDLDKWRQYIYENTRPSLSCAVEQIRVPEGTLILVRVGPSPTERCGTVGGLFKIRVGKSNMPLDPSMLRREQGPALSPDESILPRVAAQHGGNIYLMEIDHTDPFVRVPDAEDMYDI